MRQLDEKALSAFCEDVSEVVRSATWGYADWNEVCRHFTRAFPGSYCALLNQSLDRPEFGFNAHDGIEASHIRTFFEYYAYVNPWENFWKNSPDGAIIVAERDQPAAGFRNTEFYVDWMQQVGSYDAAVGMRIGLDRRELIYMPVHYDTRYADRYDTELEYIMKRLRPLMSEALRVKVQLRDLGEAQSAVAALINRDNEIALVIDRDGHLIDANEAAIREIEKGALLRLRYGRVSMAGEGFDDKLRDACKLLAHSSCRQPARFAAHGGGLHTVVRITRLPEVSVGGLIVGRPQFLIQISAGQVAQAPEQTLIKEVYGLTPKEAELCRHLGSGLNLHAACEKAGISYENGRQKLKVVFQKMQVHSQAELRAVLQRYH